MSAESPEDSLLYSVIIPAYNAAAQLDRLLGQLENQTLSRHLWEVIVVDDGSTDNSADIANAHGARLIQHEKNLGRVPARESGVAAARTEILVMVDCRVNLKTDMMEQVHLIGITPLMGVGLADKQRSLIDRTFDCIRRRVYHPFEPQHNFDQELWIDREHFDGRPKGLGLFVVKKEDFQRYSLQEKSQDVADDTKLFANMVNAGLPILRHTRLGFFYEHRDEWPALLRHTFFRGPKFLDYYLVPGGPLFKPYLLGWLAVLLLVLFALGSPSLWLAYFWIAAAGHGILSHQISRSWTDRIVFFCCFPLIAGAFISGILFAQLSRWLHCRQLVRH